MKKVRRVLLVLFCSCLAAATIAMISVLLGISPQVWEEFDTLLGGILGLTTAFFIFFWALKC